MRLLTLQTVLVATDLEAHSAPAIESARRLAAAADAPLHVVHVLEEGASSAREPRIASPADLEVAVGGLLRDAGLGQLEAKFHATTGEPAHAIRLLADRVTASVIVLGPHREEGDATERRGMGGTVISLVTNATVPCLVVRNVLRLPIERIVVPLDLSDTSRGALVVALSWASALRPPRDDAAAASLTALHVRRADPQAKLTAPQPLKRELDRIRGDAGNWAGVSIDDAVIPGDRVAPAIAEFADQRQADLVVVGTRGLGLDAVGRLGSVAADLLIEQTTPLLLVPPAVWIGHAATA